MQTKMEPHGQSPWYLIQHSVGANIPHQSTNSPTGRTHGAFGAGTEDLEFETLSSKLKLDLRSTRIMLITFFIIALIGKLILKVSVPSLVLLTMLLWFSFYLFVYEPQIKKAKNSKKLYNLYFRNNVGDLVLLTIIIHFLGAAEWIGVIFYVLVLVTSGVILPKKRAVILGIIAFFFYSTLVLLEYFEILPHRPLFSLAPKLFQSPTYLLIQLLSVAAILYFIAETAGTFSENLREKTKQLETEKERVAGALEEAEKVKKILEVKVRERTKELEELTKNQEKVIEERTKELQEKIEELEQFHRVAVGRELKMVELKEKVKSLEENRKAEI